MNLILYKFDSCPFCQMVMQYIEANNLAVAYKDIRTNPEHRDELLEIGGKTQVPCLTIDGNPLYESRDIIDWLKKNAH